MQFALAFVLSDQRAQSIQKDSNVPHHTVMIHVLQIVGLFEGHDLVHVSGLWIITGG